MTITQSTPRTRSSSRIKARTLPPEPTPYDDRPVEELWREYADGPSESLRNYFMERYLHLVRYNAERIHARLPDEVDVEDLMSAGLFGLMDAIDAFDLERKVKFETYCAPRIRGAILDELRSMDWVPRLVRHRTSRIEQARQRIEMREGRRATDTEIAGQLGLPSEEFDKYKRDGQPVMTISITRRAFSSDSGRDVREIDVIKDEAQVNPVSEAQRRDLKELMTKGLSRAERLIVILYYYEGMTMKEIGATLDLSESRVSQMHSSILQRLKSQMQHRMRDISAEPR
ncbi:MAG: FliA/WhiG family RNA polymerase sigma factor [Phycisphaeraceae bacterium]|nr:FliA/WhiG family RNA polymerase sigma factor [Phycisphaeraceae bacterium]